LSEIREKARASAYLLDPGTGQIIAGLGFSGTTKAFDAKGHLIPVASYKKFELASYIEYGFTDWLTFAASPSLDLLKTSQPNATLWGTDASELGARVKLSRTDTRVISLEAGFISPGAQFTQGGSESVLRRAWAFDLRILAAQNFELATLPAFLEAEFGRRIYAQNEPGEWHADVTFGIRPAPEILLLMQSFNSISISSSLNWPSQTYNKLALSFVTDLSPQWSVQLGGFYTIAGVNAGRELGPFFSFWYRF
jgi:hypothetical protein